MTGVNRFCQDVEGSKDIGPKSRGINASELLANRREAPESTRRNFRCPARFDEKVPPDADALCRTSPPRFGSRGVSV